MKRRREKQTKRKIIGEKRRKGLKTEIRVNTKNRGEFLIKTET